MEPKAKSYDEAALECAKELTPEDIEYFHLHIDYSFHHFGYGLYLRNRYLYLLKEGEFNDYCRDEIGATIFNRMLSIIFPEFKGYEKYIPRITEFPFENLNANYYLRYGKNFIADITPEKYFLIPDTPPQSETDFNSFWEKYTSENNNYAVAIAERIWQFDTFKQTAAQLGYSASEAEETHQLCMELLKEKYIFVPLEILFAKNATSASINAMMSYPKMIEWLFSEHQSTVKLLPSYVFENREVVKTMVSANGSLLQLAPDFSADSEIVTTALRSSTYAATFMDRSLWGDRAIAKEAARYSNHNLVFSYDAFKQFNDDDEIVMLALEANGANIAYASERIRSDYDMAVFALKHQAEIYPNCAYPFLSYELRSRKDLALIELQAPSPSLEGFTDELLDDDEVAQQLIENKNIT